MPAYNLITPSSVTVSTGTATIRPSGTVDVSAADDVIVNGVFTSDYDNYVIFFYAYSTANNNFMTLTAGGVNSSDQLARQDLSIDNTSLTGYRSATAGTRTFLPSLDTSSSIYTGFQVYIYNAVPSEYTMARHISSVITGGVRVSDKTLLSQANTSFDGFRWEPQNTYTLTGQVSVYGLDM